MDQQDAAFSRQLSHQKNHDAIRFYQSIRDSIAALTVAKSSIGRSNTHVLDQLSGIQQQLDSLIASADFRLNIHRHETAIKIE